MVCIDRGCEWQAPRLRELPRNHRYGSREPPINGEDLAVHVARVVCVSLLVIVPDSSKDHIPEARNSAAFAISVFTTSVAKHQVERKEKWVTLCNTIATHRIQLSDPVDSAALPGMIEDRSRHARLNKSWTKGVDPDVGALELPCSCLRDRVYAEGDAIDMSR